MGNEGREDRDSLPRGHSRPWRAWARGVRRTWPGRRVTRRPAGAAAGVSPGTRAGVSCLSASSSASACTRSRGRWQAAGGRSLETKKENIQERGEGSCCVVIDSSSSTVLKVVTASRGVRPFTSRPLGRTFCSGVPTTSPQVRWQQNDISTWRPSG